MNQQLVLFDYATLDEPTREFVEQRTEEIKVLVRRTAEDIWHIGQKLIEVKERLGHGNFGAWLDAEFGWTDKTARRMMGVSRHFKMDNLSDLEIAPSALYILAAPSTPDNAREDALQRAQAGEQITHTKAREIVSEYKADALRLREESGEVPTLEQWIQDNREIGLDEFNDPLPTERTQSTSHTMQVMGSSASPEWYTPPRIIELTLELFGGVIDTDPCSNSKENPNVPATTLYTKDDNGLAQVWSGSVYMNPPYGTEIPAWIEALVDKYESGEVTEAVALLPGRIDTRWFQPLYNHQICAIFGRLNFVGSPHSAPFPSVAVYLGDNRQGFIDVFGKIGPILERVS